MPFLAAIASGSSGNCALFSYGSTHILIDAGISCKRIREGLKQFDLTLSDLSAVFITHEHGDHVAGLEVLSRNISAPVFMSPGTARGVLVRAGELMCPSLRPIAAGSVLEIGDVVVTPFNTPHDTPESMGYTFEVAGHKLCYATDLGCITDEIYGTVKGSECLFIESNHDIFSLLTGGYPEYLKRRIMSKRGHLSNDDCGDFITDAVGWGARWLTLCHLSRENNTPELAATSALVAVARTGATSSDGIHVSVAPQDRISDIYCFE